MEAIIMDSGASTSQLSEQIIFVQESFEILVNEVVTTIDSNEIEQVVEAAESANFEEKAEKKWMEESAERKSVVQLEESNPDNFERCRDDALQDHQDYMRNEPSECVHLVNPSTSQNSLATNIALSSSAPLRRFGLQIGKKVLRFKIVDCARAEPQPGTSREQDVFSCHICKEEFETRDECVNHQQEVHNIPKPFRCIICGLGFVTKNSLSIHLRTHDEFKSFQCPICRKSFARDQNLQIHIKLHRWNRFFCSFCGRFLRTEEKYLEHQETCVSQMNGQYIHTDRPMRYQCSYCDKLFHHKRDKFIHERVHTGERPYQCGYCGRGFAQSQGLTIHIRQHTGERPYTCAQCGSTHKDSSSLRKHEYKHHGPGNTLPQFLCDDETILFDGDGLGDSAWNTRPKEYPL